MRVDIFKKRAIELGKMLYEQGKYDEAEKYIKDNIISAETKYLLGKIYVKKGNIEEAKRWFYGAIDIDYKWVSPRLELARIWSEEGEIEKAEEEYKVCMKRNTQDWNLKCEVARFYATQGNIDMAKQYIIKAIRTKPNNEKVLMKALELYDMINDYNEMYQISEKLMEMNAVKPTYYKTIEAMARTYYTFGKYDRVLRVFTGKTKEPAVKIMESLYRRRIYCKLTENEKQATMYQTILAGLEEAYGEENTIKHIEKHFKNNKYKDLHGVFTKTLPEIQEIIEKAPKTKQKGFDCELYCIKADGCGYQGGKKGDGHTLDYITVLMMEGTEKPITMFPSDKIKLEKLEVVKKPEQAKQKEFDFER